MKNLAQKLYNQLQRACAYQIWLLDQSGLLYLPFSMNGPFLSKLIITSTVAFCVIDASPVNHERFPGRVVWKVRRLNGQTWFARSETRVAELRPPAGFQPHGVIGHKNFAAAVKKSCRIDGQNIFSFGHGRWASSRLQFQMEQIYSNNLIKGNDLQVFFLPGNDCIAAKYSASTETLNWTSVENSTECKKQTRTGNGYNLICMQLAQANLDQGCFHYIVYYQAGWARYIDREGLMNNVVIVVVAVVVVVVVVVSVVVVCCFCCCCCCCQCWYLLVAVVTVW